MRMSRRLYAKNGYKLKFTAESFNLFNRLNSRYQLTDDGALSNTATFNHSTKRIGINYLPASCPVATNFVKATSAHAPQQLHFALRLGSENSSCRVTIKIEILHNA